MKFDHVGIAVKSIEQSLALYEKMGSFEVKVTDVAGQKARIALLKAGETSVELLEPTSEDSSLAKFLREKGEGLHHIAFAVDDIERSMDELKGRGFRFIYEKPAVGEFGATFPLVYSNTGSMVAEHQSIFSALVTDRYRGRASLKNRVEDDHSKGTTVEVRLPRPSSGGFQLVISH